MNLSTWRSPSKISHQDADRSTEIAPFGSLQEEVNRLFDQFFQAWPVSTIAPRYTNDLTFSPKMDVREDDKNISVTCDLPGMTDKDVEVTVSPGSLTIRGERKAESSRKEGGYYVSERSFGHFERTFTLPNGMDTDKAHATFKNGCLTVAVPKTAEARKSVRKLDLSHN
jgi:HSP20 family protein